MDVRTIYNCKKTNFGITFQAKDEQINAAKSVLEGRNVLVLLPTGFGKSLCYIIPTIVKSESKTITLVISPLTALIDDQIQSISEWNLTAVKLEPLSDMDSDTIKGGYCYETTVYCSIINTTLKSHDNAKLLIH